jgi:hypothetical protein
MKGIDILTVSLQSPLNRLSAENSTTNPEFIIEFLKKFYFKNRNLFHADI